MVNKFFRLKLSPQLFCKIELFKEGKVIPNKPNLSSRKKQLEILSALLIEHLGNKASFVKELVLYDALTTKFCTEFFGVFRSIESVCISSGKYYHNNLALANMFNLLKNLKNIKIDGNILNQYEFEKINEYSKLPISLKKIKILQNGFDSMHFELLERLDSTYTQLEELTIFNQRMLANIQYTYPNLTHLEFIPYAEFEIDYVIKLIELNPQLVNLTIPCNILNSNILESILSLKSIDYWKISYPPDKEFLVHSLPINTSIEHLNLHTYIPGKVLIPILNSLASLKTLEFSNYNFEDFGSIPWAEYNSKIPTLLLNGLINCNNNIDYLIPVKKFNIIKFFNIFNLNYFYINHKFNNLKNWKVIEDGSVNPRDFTLIKK